MQSPNGMIAPRGLARTVRGAASPSSPKRPATSPGCARPAGPATPRPPHAQASLITQAQQILPQAAHDARDQELTRAQTGELLGTTTATAARRYRNKKSV